MFAVILRPLCVLTMLMVHSSLDATGPLEILAPLRDTPVSRFEWGLEKYRQGLIEHFRLDPISLHPAVPPFFINVIFSEEKAEILVEIGRTFGTVEETRAREFCEEYLVRARSMLAVDRLGKPVSKGVSSLTMDYFQLAPADAGQSANIAQALDELVVLRGLVVAPASGIYAVCGAKLTNMPIRHLQSP